jgi:hypothetical protein
MPRSPENGDDLVNKSCWTKFNLVCWNCTKLDYSPTGICVFVQCLLNGTENLPIGNKAPQKKSSRCLSEIKPEHSSLLDWAFPLWFSLSYASFIKYAHVIKLQMHLSDTKLSTLGKLQLQPFISSILRDFKTFYEIRHNYY